MPRRTVNDILSLKKEGKKIVAITSYTYNIAVLTDEIADIILVGDSLGMVLYGYDSTMPVSIDLMLPHAISVVKATSKALIVFDMPFGSYESSPQQAFENASQILKKTGCNAVKIEGGAEMYDTINFLTKRGIPVLGHVGLMPQKIQTIGSYKKIINDTHVLDDAKSVADAGAFAVVLENITDETGGLITQNIAIPTIGIGAGKNTDGQICVFEDMCCLSVKQPPFAHKYDNFSARIKDILTDYKNSI